MNWRWTARRLAISAFLVFHLTAVFVINIPPCPLRVWLWWPVDHYIVPAGLDQSWAMFAPNPTFSGSTVEVLTVDKDGIQRTYSFPKMTEFSWWRAIPRVRHSKFTSQLGIAHNAAHREFATHYAIRQLNIPASSFPVHADLIYQTNEAPPFGAPRDPLKPPKPQILERYGFPTIAEVMP